ncbi:hypothetical protein P872_15720 [Rhodonellum psychrophilum GCM71 = DSM 17998]|uniref:Uncharacterized protein n=1 Tax=Rhodonellum psychrophilum GCM71 = DSM 17998 TaxID=1123057 RepID=U5C340_9BACT|nr:hypothetical protein P872_15720 [Rhodonellum psychrophilum GCM71 = DSM 17998]
MLSKENPNSLIFFGFNPNGKANGYFVFKAK